MSRKTKEAVQGAIYILPSFVLILIFCIIPIFMSGYFSFTEYNIMNSPKFVGLDNYIKMFKDSYVTDAAKNTLLYVVRLFRHRRFWHWHLQLFWQQRYR